MTDGAPAGLRGFPGWRDVPDYIGGITYDIWEGRRIGALTSLYAPGLVVRWPAAELVDKRGVIAATLATLAEFPDRELLSEDVIWCRDAARSDETSEAFLSSHRLYCTATHTGPGVYGAPTGRRLAYRILADCSIRSGAVDDEWLVRDQGAIVRQMGEDLAGWTRGLIAREGGPEFCVRPYTPTRDRMGPYKGGGNRSDWGARLSRAIREAMEDAPSAVSRLWDRACELARPGHVSGHGRAEAERFWLGLRSALPSARLELRHAVGRDDPLMAPRASVRWSLDGRHDGPGMFGPPSGAHVHVMGITHAEFGAPAGPDLIRREWTLIDETAVWKQILLQTGAVDEGAPAGRAEAPEIMPDAL